MAPRPQRRPVLPARSAAHLSHVAAVRPLHGRGDHLLTAGLLGGEVTRTDPAGIADALRPDTVLMTGESPVKGGDVFGGREGGERVVASRGGAAGEPDLKRPLVLAVGWFGSLAAAAVLCGIRQAGPGGRSRVLGLSTASARAPLSPTPGARPTAADLPVTVTTLGMRPDMALASEPCSTPACSRHSR